MPRVFISHSSRDAREAVALKRWLVEQEPGLADEIFLDIDPLTGIQQGERWKEALRLSNARCEAVICLLSAQWEGSAECRAEFRTAESLNKLILCARLEPLADNGITGEWQRCDLFGAGPVTEVPVESTGGTVSFLSEGLQRLRSGLRRAGIGAEYFPWPPPHDPNRAPYRGWEPLAAEDAAVFFGRDAQIIRGLDALRGMRSSGVESFFVILGPSGAGKSSFLRAGLLPRLQRDDRHFTVMAVTRPERNALTGDRGFAHSIYSLRSGLGLDRPALGEIKTACLRADAEQLRGWLAEAQEAAARRLVEQPAGTPPPTLVLPLDQAEELFSADAGPQARRFLELLPALVRSEGRASAAMIVAVTIRADFYERLQAVPELTGLQSVVFPDLKPMPVAQFREVIHGPAARATAAGRPLTIHPELTERLLADSSQGADTLPLLSLTLARLYEDYGVSGQLTVSQYEAIGGLDRVVQTEIDSLLGGDSVVRLPQLELLRSAFIPWLATVNPDNDQPVRRVARLRDLPAPALPLIEALVAKRLLVRDERDGETVVEVALESLLRQWQDLARWLAAEREHLKEADNLERAAAAWERSGRNKAWLLEGERLSGAESLASRTGFRDRLEPARRFLQASRERENNRMADEKQRQEAELLAAREKQEAAEAYSAVLRKRSKVLRRVVVVAVLTALVAVAGFVLALRAQEEARDRTEVALVQTREATALRLAAEGQSMLAGARPGGEIRGMQQMLAAQALVPTEEGERAVISAVVAQRDVHKMAPAGGQPVRAVASAVDGTRFASGGEDGTVRLWDAGTGQPVGEPLAGHSAAVNGVAFSPDGRRIASGSADGTVRLWDAGTGQPVGEPLAGHEQGVTSVAFSPDGRRIASGSKDGTVRLWNAQAGQPVGRPMAGHAAAVNGVAFSPDGRRIASTGDDRTVRIWNAQTGQAAGTMTGHKNWGMSVDFSRDGRWLVSGSADYTVQLWNASTGAPAGEPMTGHGLEVFSVSFHPDSRRIVSGMGDGTVRVWDAVTALPIAHDSWVTSVGISPDGRRYVSGSTDGLVRVWEAATGRPVGNPIKGHSGAVETVQFSRDGNRIASGGNDGTIRLWSTETGEQALAPLLGHRQAVKEVAFSSDGLRLASAGADGTVRLWDAVTGSPLGQPMEGHEGAVESVAFNIAGDQLASGGSDGSVRLWNPASTEPLGGPMLGHEQAVNSVGFSKDGRRLASAGADKTVRAWDVETRQPVGVPMAGHESGVNSLSFSPDGTLLASGGDDRTLRLWDVNAGRSVGEPFLGHWDSVNSVAFDDTGTQLISGSRDNSVRRWPVARDWSEALCSKLTYSLSREQWRDWVSEELEFRPTCPGLPLPPGSAGN